MGKFASEYRRAYWMGRALLCMVDDPKGKKFEECTDEEKASRYMHRAYELIVGEPFDRKKFDDMMRPPSPPNG